MDLNFVKLSIPIRENELQPAAQLLSGRGRRFEESVRLEGCVEKLRSCKNECLSRDSCPVPLLIGRELSHDPEVVRRYQKPALPFVFEMTGDAGELSLGLTLLGPSITCLALVVKVLDQMLGRQTAGRVYALDYQGDTILLNRHKDGAIDNIPILTAEELLLRNIAYFNSIERVRIELLSPLCLIRDGRQLSRFDPVFFIRSLLRRISSQFAYHGGRFEYDFFCTLSELAGRVRLIASDTTKQADRFPFRGVSGSYELAGPFQELGPYLALGGLLHLGKGAAYGMGAFTVTPIS